ncbi:MAG: hypothetical protein MUP03_06495 [Anaerolineales bacterium]|jgi:hypothetical protein|nr:hypothetical protein [Anaerolineales bacterium]
MYQTHFRLEEIIVEPESAIDQIDHLNLRNTFQSVIADIRVHQSEIILFDKGDPIITVGTTTGKHNLSMQPFPEVQHMGVEALTRFIWAKINNCKRQML